MGRGSTLVAAFSWHPLWLCTRIFLFCSLQSGDGCWGEVVSPALHSAFTFRQVCLRCCSDPAFVSFLSFRKWQTDSLCLCFPQVCWPGLGSAAGRDHRAQGSVPGYWSGEGQAPGTGDCAAEKVQPHPTSILCGVLGSGNTEEVWDMHYSASHAAILALNRGFSKFFCSISLPGWWFILFIIRLEQRAEKMEPSSSLLHLDKTRIPVFISARPYWGSSIIHQ